MHQPQYRDALSGQYVLPWTYLHAIKDYVDMAAHLEAEPGRARGRQFHPGADRAARGNRRAHRCAPQPGSALPDPVLALLGPGRRAPGGAERARAAAGLPARAAQAHDRALRAVPRTGHARRDLATPERIGYASDQFMHDLAVWYHLAWLGETVRRTDPLVAALDRAQGRDFTPAHRRELLVARSVELVGGIIPRYRALSEAGRCELSVTPYGHPIVPLLIDFHAARAGAADGAAAARTVPIRAAQSAPRWHMREGMRVFSRGVRHDARRAAGRPKARSAQETLELIEKFEFRWAASSTNVLRASLLLSAIRAQPR